MKKPIAVILILFVIFSASLLFLASVNHNPLVVSKVQPLTKTFEETFSQPITNKLENTNSLTKTKTEIPPEPTPVSTAPSDDNTISNNNNIEITSTINTAENTNTNAENTQIVYIPSIPFEIKPEVTEQNNQNNQARVIISHTNLPDFEPDEFEILYETETFASGILTKKGLEKAKTQNQINYIELDRPLTVATAQSFPLIQANTLKSMTVNSQPVDGTGQTICSVDTGVDYSHTEMGSCTATQFLNGTCSKVIAGYDYFNSDSNPVDDNGHGTALAGIAAANGPSYKGLAPGAKIVAVKVADQNGQGWASNLASGINYCVSNASQYNITTIMIGLEDGNSYNNPSLCTGGVVDTAITNAVNNNITVFAPSGNSGSITGIAFPACIPNAISVSTVEDGTGGGNNVADTIPESVSDGWSPNRASFLDFLAPGSIITVLNIPTGTITSMGTSFSTAHAAGSALLLNQYRQMLYSSQPTPSQLKNLLTATAKNITDNGTGGSNLVFPRINVLKAAKLESISPVINLISPQNNLKQFGNVNFTFNVTDHHQITSCTLYLNSQPNQTNTNIQRNTNQIFNLNLAPGTYTWQVRCTDNATNPNQGTSPTWTYKVNYPPVLNSIPQQTIAEDSTNNVLDLSAYASDTDPDTLAINIISEDPQVDCSTSNLDLIMNPIPNYFGTSTCTINIDDGLENSTTRVININVTPVNDAPVITSAPITAAQVNQAYTYQVTATDIENDTLTFSLTQSPSGMLINPATGEITWTPTNTQDGIHSITIQVDDGSDIDTQNFNLDVGGQITGSITSCEYGPMNGGELGENKCSPPTCPIGHFSLLYNEHHISGKSHYNRVYNICLDNVDTAALLSSESGSPLTCPAGTIEIGNLDEIHGGGTISREYKLCIDENKVIGGQIISCYSDGNDEANKCIPDACPSNMVSIGYLTDIRPIFSSHGKNRNWEFISYRICVE